MKELALHILDIMQNSVAAGSRRICISVKTSDDDRMMEIIVRDDGRGMSSEEAEAALDPFYTSRTTRDVGLGLPMFREAAVMTGGDLSISSVPGEGTEVRVVFVTKSIDRQPLGSLGNIIMLHMISNEDIELRLELESSRGSYCFESSVTMAEVLEAGGSAMDAAFESEELADRAEERIFSGILTELGGDPDGA